MNADKTVRTLAFFGEFGGGNKGNDASLAGGIAWARAEFPDAEISCICRDPAAVAALHGIPTVGFHGPRLTSRRVPRPIVRAVNAVLKLGDVVHLATVAARVDAVVVPGTGIFETELGAPPWGISFTGVSLALSARARRRPFALMAVGVSPSNNRLTGFFTRTTLRAARPASFRDEYSRECARAYGVDVSDATVVPDIASRLVPDAPPPSSSSDLVVGLGVLHFHHRAAADGGAAERERYEGVLEEFAVWLLARGHRVRLLVGDSLDDVIARRILEHLDRRVPDAVASGRLLYTFPSGWEDMAREVAATDVVVASRYHNLVFATLAGRPIIATGYGGKFTELVEASGAGAFSFRIETVTFDELTNAFDDLMVNRDAYAAAAADFARRSRREALSSGDGFADALRADEKPAGRP